MLNVRCSPFYEICLVDVNSALCFPRSLFQSSAVPESDALRLILFCCPVDGSTFSSDYTHRFCIYCPFSMYNVKTAEHVTDLTKSRRRFVLKYVKLFVFMNDCNCLLHCGLYLHFNVSKMCSSLLLEKERVRN